MIDQLCQNTKKTSYSWLLINQYLQQLQQESFLTENQDLKMICGNTLSPQERLELALKILEFGDFSQKWAVAKIFPRLGEIVINRLIPIIENEDNNLEYRWFATKILGSFDNPEVVISLVNLLQNTDNEELRDIIANSLANLGDLAIKKLDSLLTQPEHRFLVTKTLAQIPNPQVILSLLMVVEDPNPQIRITALEGLSNFYDERIFPVLIKALKDPVSQVRKEAVTALKFWRNIISEEILIKNLEPLLFDLNLEICQQTAISISCFKNDHASSILFRVLSSAHTPIPLQLTIIQSLGWMENQQGLIYLEKALNFVNADVILAIIQVLGEITNSSLIDQATNILIKFYQSQHSSLKDCITRKILAYSLGNLNVKDAQEILNILKQDTDHSVRLHAITALKHL
jgi:HEAT repeat protein